MPRVRRFERSVSIRVTQDELDELHAIARDMDMSVTDVIKLALDREFDLCRYALARREQRLGIAQENQIRFGYNERGEAYLDFVEEGAEITR